MKLFLTGGTGFIGSHFINIAHQANHSIVCLRRSAGSKPRVPLQKDPVWIEGNFSQVKEEDLKGCDVLVHLAAHSANVPYDTLESCIQYNVLEPLKLFQLAKKAGVTRIVVAGSCFEYGKSGERYEQIPVDAPLEPTNSYSTSKAMASLAFLEFAAENQIDLSIHRIFQVFGEGELASRLWPSLKVAAENGEDYSMTAGEQIRDFIHVSEVCEKLLHVCQSPQRRSDVFGSVFNLGSGRPMSIADFASKWWKTWGAKGKLKLGELPYRNGEVMRFVPVVEEPNS